MKTCCYQNLQHLLLYYYKNIKIPTITTYKKTKKKTDKKGERLSPENDHHHDRHHHYLRQNKKPEKIFSFFLINKNYSKIEK